MMSKETILIEIESHQQAIDKIEKEIAVVKSFGLTESVNALNRKLSFLRDNQYRYKLQGRALGMDI